MKIIGLGHYSRTGKDTFANAFVERLREYAPRLRVRKMSLAWKLKEICYDLYAWDGHREPAFYDTPEGAPYRDIKLPTIGLTPVELWVALGTDAVRNNVYDRTWLDYLLKTDHGLDVLVVPDVRFPNEADSIKEAGGTLIKVVRPGYGPRKTVADRALLNYDGWDVVIGATGKIEELQHGAQVLATCIAEGQPIPEQEPGAREWNLAVEVIEPWEPEPSGPGFDLRVDEATARFILEMKVVCAREGLVDEEHEVLASIARHYPDLAKSVTFRSLGA